MLYVNVFEKRRSDLILPPIARIQVMNIEDESTANANPSGSGVMKFASPLITSGSLREGVKYARFSPTCLGIAR